MFLCVDYRSSTYICSLQNCRMKSAWRCVTDSCSSAVCSHHFADISGKFDIYYVQPSFSLINCAVSLQTEDDVTLTSHSIASPRSTAFSASSVCFIGIQDTALPFESFGETEASLDLPQLQDDSDNNVAPLHLLLDGILSTFKRASSPITIEKVFAFLSKFHSFQSL